MVPLKSSRKQVVAFNFRACKDRNRVEHMFKLKQFRRIATQYGETALSFLGLLAIVADKLWMPGFVNRT